MPEQDRGTVTLARWQPVEADMLTCAYTRDRALSTVGRRSPKLGEVAYMMFVRALHSGPNLVFSEDVRLHDTYELKLAVMSIHELTFEGAVWLQ
jgi:hypothetical protein